MLGIYNFSIFEGRRRNEIANRRPQRLGCFYDFCGFLFRVIGEQSFPDGRVQPSASDGRAFAHLMNVSKRPKGRTTSHPVCHCPAMTTLSSADSAAFVDRCTPEQPTACRSPKNPCQSPASEELSIPEIQISVGRYLGFP
jgi:hypothetical protein